MRTTIDLDDDVAAVLVEFQQSEHVGLSRAVNELVRRGITARPPVQRFVQTASSMGEPLRSVDDIGAVLDDIEGDAHR